MHPETEKPAVALAPAAAPEPIPSAEDLLALSKEVTAEFFDNDRLSRHKVKPEAAKPETEEPPKTADEKSKEEKPEPKPKEKKPKAKVVAPTPADPDALADAVVQRLNDRQKPVEAPAESLKPAKDPMEGFDHIQRRTLDAVKYLAENDPSYKGRNLLKETIDFWKKEEDYIATWEKENKGQPFDDSDPDHADFYAKHQPQIRDDDIENAKVDVRVAERLDKERAKSQAETNKRINDEIGPIKAREAFSKAEPHIAQQVSGAVESMISEAVPEFAALIKDGLTPEAVKKMTDDDPVAFEALDREAQSLIVVVRELESLVNPDIAPYVKWDPSIRVVTNAKDSVFPHAEILDIGNRLEEAISKLPPEGRMNNGKNFVSQQAFRDNLAHVNSQKVSQQEKNRLSDIFRRRFWCIGAEDVKAAAIHKSAEKVKNILGMAEKRRVHFESKKTGADGKPIVAGNNGAPKKPASIAPPAAVAVSDLVDSRIPSNQGAMSEEKRVAEAMGW